MCDKTRLIRKTIHFATKKWSKSSIIEALEHTLQGYEIFVRDIPFLEKFYPEPKMICMVRDLRDIVASMEKNYQKHPDKATFKVGEGTTIGERVSMWMKPDAKPVGDTLNKLKEVFHRGHNRKMHIVKFEELCSRKWLDKPRQIVINNSFCTETLLDL